mgnify:FL=1|jgi:hypothetical protein
MSAIGSALISAGAGLAGSLLGGSSNKKAAKVVAKQSEKNLQTQIDYAREAANLEWERNLEQWNRENAYNDPSQVVQRLQNAGLSPALALGNYGGNTAASSPTYSLGDIDASKVKSAGAGQVSAAFGEFLRGIMPAAMEIMNRRKDLEVKDNQQTNIAADTALKSTAADLNRVEAFTRQMNGIMDFASKNFDYKMKRQLAENTLETASANLQKMYLDMVSSRKLNTLRDEELKLKQGELWRLQVDKDKYQQMGIIPGELGIFSSLKGLFYGIFKMLSGKSDKSGFLSY